MRRMYSKEQLQKLIDEVSRLIAIEELDKVVPVPTLADAGKVIRVNSGGTGYVLAEGEPLLMENIEDEAGHKRFIEGNGTGTSPTGVSINYSKWSLSGSHLMFVLDIKMAAEANLGNNAIEIEYNIPQWVYEKLFPSIPPYLDAKVFDVRVSGYITSGNHMDFYIYKYATGYIHIASLAHTAGANDEYVRVVFDFLIDND